MSCVSYEDIDMLRKFERAAAIAGIDTEVRFGDNFYGSSGFRARIKVNGRWNSFSPNSSTVRIEGIGWYLQSIDPLIPTQWQFKDYRDQEHLRDFGLIYMVEYDPIIGEFEKIIPESTKIVMKPVEEKIPEQRIKL